MNDAQMNWKRELQRTPDCPQVDRLAGNLTPAEREHVAHCARCEAEMALWEEFRDGQTSLSEAGAVQWISSELRRRMGAGSSNVVPLAARRKVLPPRVLAAAAMLVVALGIGYVVENREPSINGGALSRQDFYRSARVKVITPSGDVAASPSELQWTPVAGATNYDVTVLEVDRTVLWQGTSQEPRVTLPSTVTTQFVPGKAILWQVTARHGSTILAQSGTERFRVALP
jgi:hypothetical protein